MKEPGDQKDTQKDDKKYAIYNKDKLTGQYFS